MQIGVPKEIVILGGGVSGHAATIALEMAANVTVVDRSAEAPRRRRATDPRNIRVRFRCSP